MEISSSAFQILGQGENLMPTVRAITGSFIPGSLGNVVGGIAENIAANSNQPGGNQVPVGKTIKEVVAGIKEPFKGLLETQQQTRQFRPLPMCCHFPRRITRLNLMASLSNILRQFMAHCTEA